MHCGEKQCERLLVCLTSVQIRLHTICEQVGRPAGRQANSSAHPLFLNNKIMKHFLNVPIHHIIHEQWTILFDYFDYRTLAILLWACCDRLLPHKIASNPLNLCFSMRCDSANKRHFQFSIYDRPKNQLTVGCSIARPHYVWNFYQKVWYRSERKIDKPKIIIDACVIRDYKIIVVERKRARSFSHICTHSFIPLWMQSNEWRVDVEREKKIKFIFNYSIFHSHAPSALHSIAAARKIR